MQIDDHAGHGHQPVPADAAGAMRPFYAGRLWTNGRRERFSHYERRVGGDADDALELRPLRGRELLGAR